MSDTPTTSSWVFYKFGLLVTGRGERDFLPRFMRSLTSSGNCTFQIIGKIPQRSPVTSNKRKIRMTGSGKVIPNKDTSEIGLPARNYLNRHPNSFVILVDDLEHHRQAIRQETF